MRKIIIALSCCIVLLLLGYTSYRGYQVWKQSHGISMAKEYIAKGDTRNASLALQQVLRTNPRNVEGSRLMAGLLDSARALPWREHVLELDPGSFDDRLALVQSAIVNGDISLATNTLAGASDADKKTAAYHDAAGLAALVGGQPDVAQAELSESVRIDPSNPNPQMSLAVVRLHGTNTLDMAEARISLQRIVESSTNVIFRLQARRELISDAMRFKNFSTALDLSKDLVQQTNSLFTDKLMQLFVLKETKNNAFKPTLGSYETEAAAEPDKISALAQWQMANMSPADALTWLRGLPADTRTNINTQVLIADCLLEMNDWADAESTMNSENWEDPVNSWNNLEFMRHAYLARCLRGRGLAEASASEWGVAIQSATLQKALVLQKGSFKKLFQLAMAWGWSTEAEKILWTVVNQYPDEKWAYPILRNALLYGHRTRLLNQLMETMHRRLPNDLAIANNLVATSLLLGDQESKVYQLSQEIYQKNPTSPQLAGTYAFALYLQGKHAEAAKIMQQLDPKFLQVPSIALYYGLILKADGNTTEAKTYLDLASKAPLWPEERELLNKANAQ